MTLVSATKLGLQHPLGAGGMGEVYRASDLRHKRSVAIKVLTAHQSLSPAFRARFEQEAKSISAPQHPNICVVHDIGSQDGVDLMVMEYVAGKTLDNVIPPLGLPADVAHMSPEQAAGQPLDARSDVFSFGSVLYQMLSGKQAFQAQSQPRCFRP
jgi:serine/threonine protein kinase